MDTVKILHCADVHIGAEESFLGEKSYSRRRETLLTFEKIVDLCQENRVDILLIAGDLFHSNNIPKSFADDVISKIGSAKDLPVVYAAGNHDPYNPTSLFWRDNLPENLYILGGEETCLSFPKLNLRVYGRSFESAFLNGKARPSLIPPEDGVINISLLHGETAGDLNSRYNAISKEYIESSKMDYIALGHIHEFGSIGKIGNTFFAYSGCPEGQGFDELGQKGVLIGEIGKGVCDLKFVPPARRQHIFEKININEIGTLTDGILNLLRQKYGNGFQDNLYKIELTGNVDEDTAIDTTDLTVRLSEQLYFVKIKDKTQIKTDLVTLSKEPSLKGIFVKRMLEKIENSDETEKQKLQNALDLGLKAFSGEVKFDEN